MFRVPKPNLIESDTGFSVEQVEFTTLVYREGDRSVKISFEHLTGPSLMLLYLGSVDHWEPPFHQEKITEADWRRIGENIRDAYRSQQNREIKLDYVSLEDVKLFEKYKNPE